MGLNITVPISTEVIESNPDCKISGEYKNGMLVITIDTREQNHHQRLGLGSKVTLSWGKEHEFEVQELSAMAWPIRYRMLTRDGYYVEENGKRVHFTTQANGIDSHRAASEVLIRAAVLLVIIAGIGYRRVAWLLEQLFHVQTSKSALHRWVEEVAKELPSADEIIKKLNEKKPIKEGHFDELFPNGTDACLLVLKDEHGRIVATQEVDKRDEETVKPFFERMKKLGLDIKAFYIDGCKTYYNAIRAVYGQEVVIQYDYFHIIQNAWRHLWKWAVNHRRQIKANSEEAKTPWYKKKLESLATSLWENRYLLFKSWERLSKEEKVELIGIVEADQKVGCLRAFLNGVWRIFEDSEDERQAKKALSKLKQLPIDKKNPKPFEKVKEFIEENFQWMTEYLRYKGVKRNSLAESGMRVLRRLEISHDGFRSESGRNNCLRIYQAVKYLGWSVHRPPAKSVKIE
jgi:transposase-like protein